MAFGQQSGPPATHRQLQELTGLLHEAGHVDFRDARGPLGLTQRQAGGKFTRDEADELIEQLRRDAELADAIGQASEPAPAPTKTATPKASKPTPKAAPAKAPATRSPAPRAAPPAGGAVAAARARREAEALERLRATPDEALAAELERRGWTVTPP